MCLPAMLAAGGEEVVITVPRNWPDTWRRVTRREAVRLGCSPSVRSLAEGTASSHGELEANCWRIVMIIASGDERALLIGAVAASCDVDWPLPRTRLQREASFSPWPSRSQASGTTSPAAQRPERPEVGQGRSVVLLGQAASGRGHGRSPGLIRVPWCRRRGRMKGDSRPTWLQGLAAGACSDRPASLRDPPQTNGAKPWLQRRHPPSRRLFDLAGEAGTAAALPFRACLRAETLWERRGLLERLARGERRRRDPNPRPRHRDHDSVLPQESPAVGSSAGSFPSGESGALRRAQCAVSLAMRASICSTVRSPVAQAPSNWIRARWV
ncbi:uncharacterized protein BDR25DRAFT_378062 [Lindgomyces ingoldianus]|uniref:Uncharacterized protein n=1 Tax=Lindgomyces ingoldianus TaxID=673940 RepID=A0ACB6QG76_9PLEO|nr:uncharacterized protein BDR25DRAFT_378062 [Lindgomyces ingoldianus]KAF2465885.1 hypothetical protein BDR25DRAFT_378062 [Lindgomyces ingoldianus]